MPYQLKGNLNGEPKRCWMDGPKTLDDAIAAWTAANPGMTDVTEADDAPAAPAPGPWSKLEGIVEKK
jgi:hypothetical protein